MKCIRNKETGLVTRVSNQVASESVDRGTHVYVDRTTWRKEIRDVGKEKK